MTINLKPKIKIVYIITKSSWGGAGRYVYDLATNLPKDIFEVTVVSGGDGILIQKLESHGIKTIQIPELKRDINLLGDMAALKPLRNLFKELRPDIVHLNSSKVGGIGALAGRLAKVPKIIFTAHGFAFNEDRGIVWKTFTYLASLATAFLCHIVITISHKEEKQALRFPLLSSKKIRMIYVGIEEKEYLSRKDARKYIQGVNKKTPNANALWIGSIGELHKNKGHIKALEMCKILKEDKKDFFYFIIGEGEERENLEAYISQNDLSQNVALLGPIPDITSGSTLLKAFDVFLFPSTKEGLPYVLLEAALAEVSVITTRVGGIEEIVTHKESGLLATDIEGEVFATLIENVTYDEGLRIEYAKKLKQSVLSKFTLKNMIEETKNIYLF